VSWGQSDHIVIANVEIYNTGSAIRLFDHHDDWIVENAYLHYNSLIGFDCAPSPGINIVLQNVQSRIGLKMANERLATYIPCTTHGKKSS